VTIKKQPPNSHYNDESIRAFDVDASYGQDGRGGEGEGEDEDEDDEENLRVTNQPHSRQQQQQQRQQQLAMGNQLSMRGPVVEASLPLKSNPPSRTQPTLLQPSKKAPTPSTPSPPSSPRTADRSTKRLLEMSKHVFRYLACW
jgi:hypothetical protein